MSILKTVQGLIGFSRDALGGCSSTTYKSLFHNFTPNSAIEVNLISEGMNELSSQQRQICAVSLRHFKAQFLYLKMRNWK